MAWITLNRTNKQISLNTNAVVGFEASIDNDGITNYSILINGEKYKITKDEYSLISNTIKESIEPSIKPEKKS